MHVLRTTDVSERRSGSTYPMLKSIACNISLKIANLLRTSPLRHKSRSRAWVRHLIQAVIPRSFQFGQKIACWLNPRYNLVMIVHR